MHATESNYTEKKRKNKQNKSGHIKGKTIIKGLKYPWVNVSQMSKLRKATKVKKSNCLINKDKVWRSRSHQTVTINVILSAANFA